MSTLKTTLYTIPVALSGWIASANASAIGGLVERKDDEPHNVYAQTLRDEGLEHLWSFFTSSVLANIAKVVTPNIPEQITILPGKLIGAIWHWATSSSQSINRSIVDEGKKHSLDNSFSTGFYKSILKNPSEILLNTSGLGEKNRNFVKYALSQIGLFGLCSYALSKADEENLPGINLNDEDSSWKNIFKGAGYLITEQMAYFISQTARLYIDFKDEFGKNALAKSIANTLNEKFIPGHLLSAISGATSTYYLGKYIPKTTAAVIGEFPFKLLNRIANADRRRSTKKAITEKGKVVDNHRLSKNETNFLNTLFNPMRQRLIKATGVLFNVEESELRKTFDIDKEHLRVVKVKPKEKLKQFKDINKPEPKLELALG